MSFFVGQKVICLNSDWESTLFWRRVIETIFGRKHKDPAKGDICTVVGFTADGDFRGLILEGYSDSEGYQQDLFRPLEYKAMEIFRRIAADPKIKILETA